MGLVIRKKSEFTWLHIDSELGEFILSKFQASFDDESVQVTENGLSRRKKYNVTSVTLFDDVLNTGAETFLNITDLSLRLEQLRYPAFEYSNTNLVQDNSANHYKGYYNIITNTPALSNSTGIINDEYRCSHAGTRDFGSGNKTVGIDDIIAFDGIDWFIKTNNNQGGGGGSSAPLLSEFTLVRKGTVSTNNTIELDDLAHGYGNDGNYWNLARYKNYTSNNNIHDPANYEPLSVSGLTS